MVPEPASDHNRGRRRGTLSELSNQFRDQWNSCNSKRFRMTNPADRQFTIAPYPLVTGDIGESGLAHFSPIDGARARSWMPVSESFASSSSATSADVHSPMLSVKEWFELMLADDRIRRNSCKWVRWYLTKVTTCLLSIVLRELSFYGDGEITISSFPRATVPTSFTFGLLFSKLSISDGAKSKGVSPRPVHIELHVWEWKNRAIPLVPRLPSPYSVPGMYPNRSSHYEIKIRTYRRLYGFADRCTNPRHPGYRRP